MIRAPVIVALAVALGACRPGGPRVEPPVTTDAGGEEALGDRELRKTMESFSFHDSWDLDDDGVIDGEEFGNAFGRLGIYDAWDFDASGALETEELRQILPGGEVDATLWDTDGDGRAERAEVTGALRESLDVDGDGLVDRSEVEAGMVWLWDTDGDGILDPAELDRGSREWRLPAGG